jgi:hypothetical protein
MSMSMADSESASESVFESASESVSLPESASAAAYVASECMSVHRSLYTSQPSWCSFQGVTCGSVSGTSSYASVISIVLTSLGLSGTLPSQIGSFSSMTYLDVKYNKIYGTLPSNMGTMTSLIFYLHLWIYSSLYQCTD